MSIRRVFQILLAAQLFNIGLRQTLDPDLWWHLRTGEYIWLHGIPTRDVFSFTVPDHAWVTHEWLTEVFLWFVYSGAGLVGVSLAFALFAAAAFWLVYRVCEGRPYLAGMLVVLAMSAAACTFGARPQILTQLMAAAFVFVVERVRAGRLSRRALYVLPLLSVLWANLHSGYLLGVFLLLAYAVGEALETWATQRAGRGEPRVRPGWRDGDGSAPANPQRRSDMAVALGLVAAGCMIAALANPNGWTLWKYPWETLSSAAMQQNIAEWHSPDFHNYVYWPFAALLIVGFLAHSFSPVRPHWSDPLLFAGTAAAGLLSIRHIPLFAIAATPGISRAAAASLRGTRAYALLAGTEAGPAPGARARIANLLLLLVILLTTAAAGARRLSTNDEAIAKSFPVRAVDFLQREGLASERGFNSYSWGGYMLWRGLPVFVDGRADVYGDEFLAGYLETFQLKENWRKPLDDYALRYVLVERQHPLGAVLKASSAWREAYADDVARVFVRADSSR